MATNMTSHNNKYDVIITGYAIGTRLLKILKDLIGQVKRVMGASYDSKRLETVQTGLLYYAFLWSPSSNA